MKKFVLSCALVAIGNLSFANAEMQCFVESTCLAKVGTCRNDGVIKSLRIQEGTLNVAQTIDYNAYLIGQSRFSYLIKKVNVCVRPYGDQVRVTSTETRTEVVDSTSIESVSVGLYQRSRSEGSRVVHAGSFPEEDRLSALKDSEAACQMKLEETTELLENCSAL